MPEHLASKSDKIGLPPGTPVFVGEQRSDEIKMQVIDYGESVFDHRTVDDVKALFPYRDKSTISWINIDGLHDVDLVQGLCQHFEIHPLVIEDILSPQQRPKIEVFDQYLYIVFKMLNYQNEEIVSEQISLILGKTFVITFQEVPGDIFDSLRERIEKGRGRIRKNQSDYLAYSIMDVVIDHYFLVLESLGDEIESLEENVLNNPQESFLEDLYYLRHRLIYMRKATWPLREVVSTLQRGELTFIKKSTLRFIGDLYDHIAQVIDTVETNREMVSSILDVYLSMMSNKMNEIMKVLTIIATIFIPLSFLAGVYGMNFDMNAGPFNMPELSYKYGYLIFWGISLLTGGGLVFFFRRKKWL